MPINFNFKSRTTIAKGQPILSGAVLFNEMYATELDPTGQRYVNRPIHFGDIVYTAIPDRTPTACKITGFLYDAKCNKTRAVGYLASKGESTGTWVFDCSINGMRLNIGLFSSNQAMTASIKENGVERAEIGNICREIGATKKVIDLLAEKGFCYNENDGVYKWEWDGTKSVKRGLTIDKIYVDETGFHVICEEAVGLELYKTKGECDNAHIRTAEFGDKVSETEAKVEINVKVSVKDKLLAESKTEIKAKIAELKDLGIDLIGLV